ncbi:MAG: hypothetical protein HY905_07680 [Deltaproteobacteria bacterium]|nr:hypothetical protein [Deltaproteobacteria bacterium]
MVFEEKAAGVLAWRHRPWIPWSLGVTALAGAFGMGLTIDSRWQVRCAASARVRAADGTVTGIGTCRVERGPLLWTTRDEFALDEIVGVGVEHRVDRDRAVGDRRRPHRSRRRDVLEASVRDLRRFLGFDPDADLEPPRPDLAPQPHLVVAAR